MKRNAKFCDGECYAEASRKGMVPNNWWFKKGATSLNKGRTLESWVGEERAADIRARMSRNSKKKGDFLRSLNERKDLLRKRLTSRWFHESVVEEMVEQLRSEGWRCYILSEYIKEKRTPDAILFDGEELVALEVELQKKWKASEESMTRRLSDLNQSFALLRKDCGCLP